MNFDDIVKAVSEVMPPFNNFALKTFVKDNIDSSPDFPALILKEGCKLVNADVEFMDYKILNPEDRVKFELRSGGGKTSRAKVPLTVSHLRLIQYRVRFGDQYVYTKLYTPYMYEDMLHIKGKRSMVRKVILEKTFGRVNEKNRDGVSVSPIRVNLTYNRRETFRAASYITGSFYTHFVVTARMHNGTVRNKICEPTIIGYMLAKFGFDETVKRFGLSKKDILFVSEIGQDTNKFEYFAAKKFNDRVEEGPGLFLKVKHTLLADDQSLKFIINLLYILSFFQIQTIENVYVADEWSNHLSIWKVILGFVTSEDRVEPKAYSNAEAHIRSVDYFIDPITRNRFNTFGIPIEDIYDLLVYTFIHIDSMMVNNLAQDLYNSRLDVSNGILVETYARKMFYNIYYLAKKTNIGLSDVEAALRFNPMLFRTVSSGKKDDAEHYLAPPDIVGDNFLFSGGLSKIRLGGKAEQRIHPSMLVAESIDAFGGKYIGKTGYINPYIPTDQNGAILHPEYAKEIDDISPFLPR